MRWEKKLAFLGIFSLVIITMIFAIVRVSVISALSGQPDTTWLYFWSTIEQCVGKTSQIDIVQAATNTVTSYNGSLFICFPTPLYSVDTTQET